MDIFKYAEEINYGADYYDMATGYIYHIVEAGKKRKLFGIDTDIRVSENGVTIGYARRLEK